MTAGSCGAGVGGGLTCGAGPTNLYPAGHRCALHTPARLAGLPEPGWSSDAARGMALRDQGVQRADNAADPTWKQQVDAAIAQLAASGRLFTADDVRALGVPEPASPQAWGARMLATSRSRRIVRVGYRPSMRPSVHAHPIAVWQGVAS